MYIFIKYNSKHDHCLKADNWLRVHKWLTEFAASLYLQTTPNQEDNEKENRGDKVM